MEAIPRGLVSRDMIIPGIKCLRTNILPSHHSGNHKFTSTASNKVTFQIPSFPSSYINTKRSFIRFVLKTSANGVLVPQANPFRRLLLKSSRGQVLEDIDNYDVLCRLFQNMKTKQTLEAEAVSTKDIRAVDVGKNFSKMMNASGQLAKHTLQSGILSDWQEYLVHVSSMVAASGYAFQLELFLNEDAKVVGSTNTNAATYSLEEVSFDVALVEVSDAIMADINSEYLRALHPVRLSRRARSLARSLPLRALKSRFLRPRHLHLLPPPPGVVPPSTESSPSEVPSSRPPPSTGSAPGAISARVSSSEEVCTSPARAAARFARAASENEPTVMRLATARAANLGAAKLRSKRKSGRSGRSGQPAGLAHFFQTKKIHCASPACRWRFLFVAIWLGFKG